MKFEIKNRRTGFVQVTTEIECNEGESYGIKLGRAVKWATDARADLTGADLAGADLTDADLAGAYLARAYLAGANLAGADLTSAYLARANLAGADLAGAYLAGTYLARANLARADLAGAYIARADLAGAYLVGANLARADLTRAYLAGAHLAGAYLARADLTRAYLAGANLAGAKWRNHIILTRNPLQIYGLAYPVTILDDHIEIGCELHKISAWAAFDDARIALMDGVKARRFWAAHGATLIAMARADGRGVSTPVEQAAE